MVRYEVTPATRTNAKGERFVLLDTSDDDVVWVRATLHDWYSWHDRTYPLFMATIADRERTLVDWSPT